MLLASVVNASEINYQAVHKQLDIMNNIIQSSVKAQRGASKAKISSINSVYLQGQGAVFTINSHNSHFLGHRSFQFVMPSTPVAQVASSDVSSSTDMSVQEEYFADNEDMLIQFESAADEYERVIEVYEQQRMMQECLEGSSEI